MRLRLWDWLQVQIHLDASAAKGIIERQGLQKIRHIEVDLLWLQEMQARRILPIQKIKGEINPADIMTNYLVKHKFEAYVTELRQDFRKGTAEYCPYIG